MPIRLSIDLRPRIQFMDINTRKLVATTFSGDHESVFKGRGVVFDSYREYSSSNDDASSIDWRASQRAGHLMVRQYVEERNIEVFIILDGNHTMVSGSQKKLKHEFGAEIVASMSYVILDRGNSVGLGIMSDSLRGFLPPERGVAQFSRIATELSNSDHYDRPLNFEASIRQCVSRLRPQTLVVLITDGMGLRGDWESVLRLANSKFEVLAIMVRDPLDDELPEGAGQIAVEDPRTGAQVLIDTSKIRADYAHAAKELKERVLQTMHRSRITDVPIIRTDQDFAKEVTKFFERQKRK